MQIVPVVAIGIVVAVSRPVSAEAMQGVLVQSVTMRANVAAGAYATAEASHAFAAKATEMASTAEASDVTSTAKTAAHMAAATTAKPSAVTTAAAATAAGVGRARQQ